MKNQTKGGSGSPALPCSAGEFPERLAAVIEESGLSRPQFAAKIGVGTSCLAKWLNGHLLPKSLQLLAIAQATGKTMEWLLIGDTEKQSLPND